MTSIDELYNTLTTQKVIYPLPLHTLSAWFTLCLQLVATFTNSSVKLEPKKGGLFSLLDGLISGEYMELVGHMIVTWIHILTELTLFSGET